jgi:nucleotide-binding universal stress UspA family protein
MFRKLLVPLDLSPLAEQALGQAAAIARTCGASIDLVSVHLPFPYNGYEDAPWHVHDREDTHRYLETVVAELKSGSGLVATHAVMTGRPAEMIGRRIEETGADLVVMTSHGRTGFSRAWLGSVADEVLRHVTVPVLLLRSIETKRERAAAHELFKHVLIPVSGSTFSTEVFPFATTLAKCSGARVTLLQVIQPIPLSMPDAGMPYNHVPLIIDDRATRLMEEDARKALTREVDRLRAETGLQVDGHVEVESNVAHAVIDFARTHAIDLVAMSTHARGASRLLVGSVADKVLRASDLPLLLYHPTAAKSLDARELEASHLASA